MPASRQTDLLGIARRLEQGSPTLARRGADPCPGLPADIENGCHRSSRDASKVQVQKHGCRSILRYLEFEVTLKDCSLVYGADQCQWAQQRVKIAVGLPIPPNQTRSFTAEFSNPPHAPQTQRSFSWRIVIASSCDNLSAHQCVLQTW